MTMASSRRVRYRHQVGAEVAAAIQRQLGGCGGRVGRKSLHKNVLRAARRDPSLAAG